MYVPYSYVIDYKLWTNPSSSLLFHTSNEIRKVWKLRKDLANGLLGFPVYQDKK